MGHSDDETPNDPSGDALATVLLTYLQQERDGVLEALEGLGEYDVRRPMTPTGTNLLGLVKHLAGIELGYLADSVGRPAPEPLPWVADGSVWDGADMWASEQESRAGLIELYRAAARRADESVALLGLHAPATVAWWPPERRETTLGALLVRVVAETARHAGHCDIVRELLDGRSASDPETSEEARRLFVERIAEAADRFHPNREPP